MITLQEYIAETQGKAISYDGLKANAGQCAQLVCEWWLEGYGFRCPLVPAAKDLWTNPTVLANFSQLTLGDAQPGDVIVWNASAAINSPVFGHTDIFIGFTNGGFNGWDSNWGNVTNAQGQPIAHQVTHTSVAVFGALRWKGASMNYTNEQENQMVLNATGAAPGAGYSYKFAGKPITEDSLNKFLQYQAQLVAQYGGESNVKPYSGPQLYTKT